MVKVFAVFMCSVVLSGCGSTSSSSRGPVPLALGGVGPGGGVVFTFFDNSNMSGLEVFPTAIGESAWGCVGVNVDAENATRPTNGIGVPTGAESSALLFEANTNGVCFSEMAELVAGFTNNGVSDWYLPSTDELISIRDQGFLPGEPGDGFWSATEDSELNAFTVLIEVASNEFDGGEPSTTDKSVVANIIPIRTF